MTRRVVVHLSLAWLALMVLLALTCGTAYLALGPWNAVINFGVAVLKALLVVVVFMEIGAGSSAVKVVAVIGLALLAILVGLSLTDFVPRYTQPGGARASAPR